MTATAGDRKPHDERDRPDDHHVHRHVVVTVVAPNNVSRTAEVDLHDRVNRIAREAVQAFVHAHQMESMPCSIALVVDGAARLLDDTARLHEAGVQEHARLVLVPKRPKTDG